MPIHKILIVESDHELKKKITDSLAREECRFELNFRTHAQIKQTSWNHTDYHSAIVNFYPDPQSSFAVSWSLRSHYVDLGIAILVPSVGFMVPAEIIEIGLGPIVVADDEGIASLPSVLKSMMDTCLPKDSSHGTSQADLRRRNQELRDMADNMARQGANLVRLSNELSSEKSKMQNVINCMIDGLAFFDVEGRLELMNIVARKFLPKYSSDKETGRERVLRDLRKNVLSTWRDRNESISVFECKLDEKILRIHHDQVSDSSGKSLGSLILLLDITQDKEVETLKNDFTNMISHELRTPLTSISATVDNFMRGSLGEVTVTQQKFLELIARNVDRQEELINNLLDLARLEANRMDVNIKQSNLCELVQMETMPYSFSFKNKGVGFQTNFDHHPLELPLDQNLICQALHNLLSNALKFVDKGDNVEMRCGRVMLDNREFARITVADTGIGINPSQLSSIFEKYAKAGSSEKRSRHGAGLGLAICKEIMKLHHGSITVESRLGVGSKFHLNIPFK